MGPYEAVQWTGAGSFLAARTSEGETALVETRAPFRLTIIDSSGDVTDRAIELDGSIVGRQLTSGVYATSIVPIDCGRVVVSLSDIRSQDRWVALVGTVQGTLIKTTKLSGPVTFIGADVTNSELYALWVGGEQRQIVTYRWNQSMLAID